MVGALAALGEIRTEPGAASWSQVATRGGSVPEVRDRRAPGMALRLEVSRETSPNPRP